MSLNRWVGLGLLSMSLALLPAAWAQDSSESVAPASEEVSAPAPAPEKAEEPAEEKSMEWIWGEVVSVTPAAKEIVIKHLDYDTYEETQTSLTVNDKTSFENTAGLAEIKPREHITADTLKTLRKAMVLRQLAGSA